MLLLEPQPIIRLQREFRLSMRRLLIDLCRELHGEHADLAREFGLQTSFFDKVYPSLPLQPYSSWKVVGWIEMLNDLVYLLDVLKQWRCEQDRSSFASQFFDECREKFFEHSYFDDLFPRGHRHATGLEKRLVALCRRLSQELTQEALWIDPAVAVKWLRQRKMRQWDVPGIVADNFERSEMARTLPVDLTGSWCEAPTDLRPALGRSGGNVLFRVEPVGISLKVGKPVSLVWLRCGDQGVWQWPCHSPLVAIPHDTDPVTVGQTLVYGKDRQPKTVKPTDQRQVNRIARAWQTIKWAWPEGHAVLALLTSRIIPLRARGVVSFSYRHRPGLSFINCFDRGNLDLIDDLIHENSHHHLNLLLRKHIMYHRDHNQQIFYSPWRRSLRPLRGILHATFTFTMGALLFERLSSWASGRGGSANWKAMGLTQHDLRRARFRCLEEVESVRYSLQDLHYADHHLKWLTGSGRRLVRQLTEILDHVDRSSAQFRQEVLRSSFGPLLRRQIKELQTARQRYGPMRLGPV